MPIHLDFSLTDAIDAFGRIWNKMFPSTVENDKKLIDSCRTSDLQNVQSLLRGRIDINAHDEKGRTLLIIASSKGDNDSVGEKNFHLVKLLLSCDADVTAVDHYGNTALIMASRNGAARIVKTLIDAGSDVNAHNDKGWTGLMRAVKHGYPKTAKVLLANGADKDICNEDGEKAIDILIKNRDEIIRNRGASVYNELLDLLI